MARVLTKNCIEARKMLLQMVLKMRQWRRMEHVKCTKENGMGRDHGCSRQGIARRSSPPEGRTTSSDLLLLLGYRMGPKR